MAERKIVRIEFEDPRLYEQQTRRTSRNLQQGHARMPHQPYDCRETLFAQTLTFHCFIETLIIHKH